MLLFADVVEHGSFTTAAQLHGISKQAASKRVSNLEQALGVRLLARTTRSLKATEAGLRYQAQCLQIAQLVAQANANLQAERDEPSGSLTISAPRLFGRSSLIGVLDSYRRLHPNVHLKLCLTDRMVDLVDSGVDVALRVSHMKDSTLSVRRLGKVQAYFVASPKLLESLSPISDLELITSAPALTFRPDEVWSLPDGSKHKPNPVVTINDLEALSAAAAQGLGVTRIPGLLCGPLIAEDKLRVLLEGAPAASYTVYAAYLSKKQLSIKIRSFIDMLVEQRALFTEAA